jgi:hypothetical protein
MTHFYIQIHPHRSPQLDLAGVRSECESLAAEKAWVRRFSWEEGYDNHAYINLMFETDYPKLLWKLLYEQLYQARSFGQLIQASSIAMCEGRHGWDDYLLLHHFDPEQRCDDFLGRSAE